MCESIFSQHYAFSRFGQNALVLADIPTTETKIGEKIHRIRRERGYTAEQFAEMLGISTVSLRKYEYGERTPKEPMIAEIA